MTDTRDGRDVVRVPTQFVEDVREMLTDDALSNELVEGREFSDPFLAKCIVYVMRDYDATPPILSGVLTIAQLLSNLASLRPWILEAAAGRALYLGGLRRMRNQASYTVGSLSFDPNAAAQAMMRTGSDMLAKWDQRKQGRKVADNINGAFYSASSELGARETLNDSTIEVTGGPIG